MEFFRVFLGIFRRILGGIFLEEFIERNYLVEINKELMILSRFWGNFVSMEGRRKDFRSLEVRRRKLIALKNVDLLHNIRY